MSELLKTLQAAVSTLEIDSYRKNPVRKDTTVIPFTAVDDPSFEVAAKLDANGQWQEAGNHYYTLFHSSPDATQKAAACILLAQEYINTVQYTTCRKFLLENKNGVLTPLAGWTKIYYEAQIFEKLGWINDYFGEIEEGIVNFSHARDLLANKAKKDDTILRTYETANHFLGRLHTILAWQGVDVPVHAAIARERFKESLEIYQRLRHAGSQDDTAEGFQYAWLTRIDILEGKLEDAQQDLARMHALFTSALKEHPKSGIFGYYYLLLGKLEFEKRNCKEAEAAFREALRISTDVVHYPPTQADAFMGIALTEYAQGKTTEAKRTAHIALAVNPSLLYRGYV